MTIRKGYYGLNKTHYHQEWLLVSNQLNHKKKKGSKSNLIKDNETLATELRILIFPIIIGKQISCLTKLPRRPIIPLLKVFYFAINLSFVFFSFKKEQMVIDGDRKYENSTFSTHLQGKDYRNSTISTHEYRHIN